MANDGAVVMFARFFRGALGAPALVAALVFVAIALAPRLAWACPSCAGSEEGGARIALMFVMIGFPFVIAYVAYRFIRKAGASRSHIGRTL